MSSPYARPRLNDRRPAALPTGAAAPAGPTLAEALVDRDVALIRIRARCDARFVRYHDLTAFTAAFRRVWFHPSDYTADQAVRTQLAAWHMQLRPEIDWRYDHQIDLATGVVTAAPEAWEAGFIPDDDLCFNGGPAVWLPAQTAVAA